MRARAYVQLIVCMCVYVCVRKVSGWVGGWVWVWVWVWVWGGMGCSYATPATATDWMERWKDTPTFWDNHGVLVQATTPVVHDCWDTST